MNKNQRKTLLFISLFVLALSFSAFASQNKGESEKGNLSIYFMEEKVGYEDYSWELDDQGYTLHVTGRMTKPIPVEIESLAIRLSKKFIPREFSFKGTVNGVLQEISSSIAEGKVENTIRVAGQETKLPGEIKRDAFLLPNPIFSPFMVLTKKFGCTLQDKVELSAYIIPQLEAPFTFEPKKDQTCFLLLKMSGIDVELQTNEKGELLLLSIPAQNLKVIPKIDRTHKFP
jgi:hypothetical protein